MYPKIFLKPEDQVKYGILSWLSTKDSLKDNFLKTERYWLNCAPWHAVGTLQEVADNIAYDEERSWMLQISFVRMSLSI